MNDTELALSGAAAASCVVSRVSFLAASCIERVGVHPAPVTYRGLQRQGDNISPPLLQMPRTIWSFNRSPKMARGASEEE
ncbi:unnamed protein product [Lampetra fluviatilis]